MPFSQVISVGMEGSHGYSKFLNAVHGLSFDIFYHGCMLEG